MHGYATIFNAFYRDNRVIDAEEPAGSSRLALVRAFKKTMKEGMDALGISALESM